ncbi:uncharacterized protein LOC114170264 [Vigna unguiculata]|uniref:uncharacterized protein LOC114170264 n=1 Tax=Vigna unguiculata TaxID=3917 RepID=UPI001015DBCC|nr:uncharacterized protein LOC114170264 [Vigna unguiculata]
MSIGKYAAKFDELSKFCPYFHDRVDERFRCSKFESGLKPDIKQAVGSLEISSFPTLVNRCRIYEDDTKARQTQWRQGGPLRHKINDFNNKKPCQRPSNASWNFSGQKHSSPTKNSGITNPIKCFHCGGPHLSRNCTTRTITCFNCGKLGLYCNECKELIKEQGSGGSNNGGKNQLGRLKTTGRVFTMNDTEVVQSEDLIQGKGIINGHLVNVLYDSGEVFYSKELKESTTNHDEISKGSQVYMILTSLKVKEISDINKFSVVCEHLDVFPEDVPGLPPQREIEFTIDLVSGSRPVSIAPYRMSPLEFAELKKQIEELLDKQFIRPSVSP